MSIIYFSGLRGLGFGQYRDGICLIVVIVYFIYVHSTFVGRVMSIRLIWTFKTARGLVGHGHGQDYFIDKVTGYGGTFTILHPQDVTMGVIFGKITTSRRYISRCIMVHFLPICGTNGGLPFFLIRRTT